MKVRIFNRGKGWYVSATNYKNNEDKAYMNVYFGNHDEPIAKTQEREFDFTDIDVIEAKFGAYNGKITMTVFKYEPFLNGEVKGYESIRRDDVPTTIDEEDLPW